MEHMQFVATAFFWMSHYPRVLYAESFTMNDQYMDSPLIKSTYEPRNNKMTEAYDLGNTKTTERYWQRCENLFQFCSLGESHLLIV